MNCVWNCVCCSCLPLLKHPTATCTVGIPATLIRPPAALPTCPSNQEHGAALCVHFIGAHPQRQGQGLGGAMLSHICELADQRRLHAYLEASTHRSKVRRRASACLYGWLYRGMHGGKWRALPEPEANTHQ